MIEGATYLFKSLANHLPDLLYIMYYVLCIIINIYVGLDNST